MMLKEKKTNYCVTEHAFNDEVTINRRKDKRNPPFEPSLSEMGPHIPRASRKSSNLSDIKSSVKSRRNEPPNSLNNIKLAQQ